MNQLLPAFPQEQLVAQGCYSYLRNGELMNISENWTIHQFMDMTLTRSTRLAPDYGTTIQVESLSKDNEIVRIELVWLYQSGDISHRVNASYFYEEGFLEVFRTADGERQDDYKEAISDNTVSSPLMRIYTGAVIQKLISQGGTAEVLVPWIRDPDDTQRIYEPLKSARSAVFSQRENLEFNWGAAECNCYEYTGGEYQPGSLFWLDDDNTLLQYRWQQDADTCWDTVLTEYQREASQ
ncbi:MAG: hypothetical protein V7711_15445 [Pseudomonadales bacterium]